MNGDDEKFTLIPTNAVSLISEVRLYDDTLDHILEEHPEFALPFSEPVQSISSTIEDPTHVYQSATNPAGSLIYVSTRNTYEDNPLVVPVKIVEGTSGRVRTAYYTERTSGSLLWSESNE